MCQCVLRNPSFYSFLCQIDDDHAATIREQRCIWCAGPLHQANFERKPRGFIGCADPDTTRLSFCCGDCRLRCTPASVRFLGRRVYWGAIVILATALCSGLSLRRGHKLSQQLGVPASTILRWRHWWLTQFTASAVWQTLRGKLLAPIAEADLPGELLSRAGTGDERLLKVLRWLAPLSTVTEVR